MSWTPCREQAPDEGVRSRKANRAVIPRRAFARSAAEQTPRASDVD